MSRFIAVRFLGVVFAGLLAASCGGSGASGPNHPVISDASVPSGVTGTAYSAFTFTVASGGTAPFTWTQTGNLPPGLSLSPTGQLSGTPVTAGTYPITVTVTDSSNPPLTGSAPLSLVIADSSIVVSAVPPPPAGTVTYPYPGYGFTATGGSPPYTWHATAMLPPGLTMATDGTVSGTPTNAGSFSFSVAATDSAQTPVSGPPLATQILINNPSKLTLNALPAPPAGVEFTPYGPFSFSTTGGFQPLHWSISAGALPPGMTLGTDGSVSGIPMSAGSFSFTVSVTDSAPTPATSSLPFSINVGAAPPPPPPTISYSEPPTATVGTAYGPFQFTESGGLAPLQWSATGAQLPNLTLSTGGALSGTPNAPGQFPIMLNVTDALSQHAPPVPVVVRVSLPHPGSFTTLAAHLIVPRSGHTATLLNTGKVMIAGGANGLADASAELYDPATGSLTATAGSMTELRIGHTATLLNDSSFANYGKVLIVGSIDTTAELYDPSTETFKATGSMHHARTSPTATLLSNSGPNAGKVLIVGGNTTAGDLVAELYDPATQAFSDTGSTTILRTGNTATLLTTGALAGQVLIAGGSGSKTAELYNPGTGLFTTTGSMTVARTGHTATALGAQDGAQNGDLLIVGTDGSTELFDQGTAKFTAVGSFNPPSSVGIASHRASLRNDGTVVVTGGYRQIPIYRRVNGPWPWQHFCVLEGTLPGSSAMAAVFAPESDGFTPATALNTSRDGHTATVLADGAVLVVGGVQHSVGYSSRWSCISTGPAHSATVLSSVELFK